MRKKTLEKLIIDNRRYVVARMVPECPTGYTPGCFTMPKVIASDCPNYRKNDRLDYGQIRYLLEEGFSLIIDASSNRK